MNFLPPLLKTPAFIHDLNIKATQTGIVFLNEGRYRKRYTGSRTSVVDINGKLHLKAADYKKYLAAEIISDRGASKKRIPQVAENPGESDQNQYGLNSEVSTNNDPQPKEKNFSVNKVEVRNRILGMVNTVKRGKAELYFWTVTFPQAITDDLAYRAFNIWLTRLRQSKILRNYLWIAERQTGDRLGDGRQATNNIHFHIAIPHKMSVVVANRYMRETLSNFCKNRLMDYSVYQCKRYNGVDIAKNRSTRKVTNFAVKKGTRSLVSYLTKYVTKNDSTFNHLAWHNSRGFSALFTGLTFTVPEFVALGFHKLVRRSSVIRNEFFMFFPWLTDPPDKIINHLADLNIGILERLGLN